MVEHRTSVLGLHLPTILIVMLGKSHWQHASLYQGVKIRYPAWDCKVSMFHHLKIMAYTKLGWFPLLGFRVANCLCMESI